MANNTVKLVGNLVANPEVKTSAAGKEFVAFRLAVNKSYKVKEGAESADFFRCVAGGNVVAKMKGLEKGAFVEIEGELGTRSYPNKDGVTMYETFVRPSSVRKIEAKAKAEATQSAASAPAPGDDDLPF